MRSDLTAAFIAAKNSGSRKPRQLLVFQFPVAGNVYASDQEITLGGVTYLPLVEDWGTLADAAGAESDFSAETRQISVTLWNGGDRPFSTRFLQEDPENVEVLLYQWFDGLADSDKLLLDRFVIQDPISFSEASRLLTLDFVSINMRYVGRCGTTVTTSLWPKALPEHVGQAIPLIFGSAGECNTLCVKTAPRATMFGSIAKGSMTISCNESLGSAGFPASGILQIEEEKIQYSSRTDKVFTVSVRGYGNTEKTSHPDNAEVHQLITDHTYILGELPIASITDVKVDGHPAPAGTYSISLAGSYGKVIFNQKPYSWQYASSSMSLELFGFVTAADNTAWQAHYAYDQNKTSSSAMINEVYPTLSINLPASLSLADVNGLMVTAYLEVHHWETDVYANDYVEVWVEGIGVVGRLVRPSADDIFNLEANVDLDHSHNHRTGDSHTHPHQDANYGANASGHVHPVSGDGFVATGVCKSSLPTTVYPIDLYNPGWKVLGYNIEGPAGATWTGAKLRLRITVASVKVVVTAGGVTLWTKDKRSSGSESFDITLGFSNQSSIKFTVYGSNVNGAHIYISEATLYWLYDTTMQPAASAVTPYVADAGSNQTIYNTNQPDDVYPLLTDNRDIEIFSQQSPSRTLIDRFDLSDFIDPSWTWFTSRKVQVRYKGTANDVNVFIPWITFVVEFRKRERVYSNRVTATVSGSTLRRPDQVLQTLLGKAGLPTAYIDTTAFSAAGTWYTANGYGIDGVIEGDLTVAEAIKKVCRQTRSRLFWSGGVAKLSIRKTAAQQTISKFLTGADYQLRSIVAERQPVADLVNRIELFYNFKRTPDSTPPALVPLAPKERLKSAGTKSGQIMVSSQQPYLSSLIKEDTASIAAHGLREQPDAFRCDLIRDYAMALSVAAYYLDTLAYPSTVYQFNAYLPQAELEKEDVIALTAAADFHKIRKMPLRIKDVARIFGSGKNRSINHLRIVAECLRYILLEQAASDSVLILDALTATIGKLVDMADHVHVQDDLTSAENAGLAEELIIEDVLDILFAAFLTLEETMTIEDELGCGINVAVADQVNILEQLTVWRDLGFGSGDFGTCGFGGVKTWNESNPDEVLFVDVLGSGMNVAPVFDWEYRGPKPKFWLGPWSEWVQGSDAAKVTVTDALAFSNQFGSAGTLSSGFANIPFGR